MISSLSIAPNPVLGRDNGPETWPGIEYSERGDVIQNLTTFAGTPTLWDREEIGRISTSYRYMWIFEKKLINFREFAEVSTSTDDNRIQFRTDANLE